MPRTETIALRGLWDAPRNENRMSAEEYAALLASVRRWGLTEPLVVRVIGEERVDRDDGAVLIRAVHEIVGGHHRRTAGLEAGLEHCQAVVYAAGELPDSEAAALRVALNRVRGRLSLDLVAQTLQELLDDGWTAQQAELTGFSSQEVAALLEPPSSPEDAAVDASLPPAEPFDDSAGEVSYELTLVFRAREDLAAARRFLKKAAGRGAPLAEGLLRVMGAERGRGKKA